MLNFACFPLSPKKKKVVLLLLPNTASTDASLCSHSSFRYIVHCIVGTSTCHRRYMIDYYSLLVRLARSLCARVACIVEGCCFKLACLPAVFVVACSGLLLLAAADAASTAQGRDGCASKKLRHRNSLRTFVSLVAKRGILLLAAADCCVQQHPLNLAMVPSFDGRAYASS